MSSNKTVAIKAIGGLVHINSQPITEKGGKITRRELVKDRSYEKVRQRVKSQQRRGENKKQRKDERKRAHCSVRSPERREEGKEMSRERGVSSQH